MFQIGKTIVSEDIIEKDFLCNLSACKGACCVDGDAGAPLEANEAKILEKIYLELSNNRLLLKNKTNYSKDCLIFLQKLKNILYSKLQ